MIFHPGQRIKLVLVPNGYPQWEGLVGTFLRYEPHAAGYVYVRGGYTVRTLHATDSIVRYDTSPDGAGLEMVEQSWRLVPLSPPAVDVKRREAELTE